MEKIDLTNKKVTSIEVNENSVIINTESINRFKKGEWVRVKKPKSSDEYENRWVSSMDKFDNQIFQINL